VIHMVMTPFHLEDKLFPPPGVFSLVFIFEKVFYRTNFSIFYKVKGECDVTRFAIIVLLIVLILIGINYLNGKPSIGNQIENQDITRNSSLSDMGEDCVESLLKDVKELDSLKNDSNVISNLDTKFLSIKALSWKEGEGSGALRELVGTISVDGDFLFTATCFIDKTTKSAILLVDRTSGQKVAN